MFKFKHKIGDRVVGNVLFGDGLRLEGEVIKQDAEISRDAIVVRLDNGDTAVMLTDSTERIQNEDEG